MTVELIVIIGSSILGLIAHASRRFPWLEWLLRSLYVILLGGQIMYLLGSLIRPEIEVDISPAYVRNIVMFCAVLNTLILFKQCREWLSKILTVINQFILGRWLVALYGKSSPLAALIKEPIFVANSIPHLNAIWLYINCMAFLLASISPEGFDVPKVPIPMPVTLPQLFTYNGFSLILLSVCGVGILVARKPGAVLQRLGLVKPSGVHVLIGIAMIFVTFAYDAVWANFTHQHAGDIGGKLADYNTGSFDTGKPESAGAASALAAATGLFAGVGEEVLIRGAVMPALGAVLAGILHGVLHGQFAQAPILVVQVSVWSIMMCVVRRYTNTTTTIITHAGYNFISTFLFAFNP